MSEALDNNLFEARRWLKQAEEHLAVAEWNGQGRFWPAACFHCQQAGELAMKAVLLREGERNLRVHTVLGLLRRAAEYDAALRPLEPKARRLDRYYIGTRYPNGLGEGTASDYYDEADFQEARSAAAELIEMAHHRLAP
jgi:HEPN domain-containing protein